MKYRPFVHKSIIEMLTAEHETDHGALVQRVCVKVQVHSQKADPEYV